MLGNLIGGGIHAREPLIVILDVEARILGNDDTAGKEIGPEPRVLPTHLGCVKDASDIVPAERADQAFFTVGKLLPSDFKRDREFLVVAESDEGLVKIERVRFRPAALIGAGAGN